MTFAVQEDVASIGQADTILSKYAIGESAGSTGDIVEDDYGVSVKPELFTDIVSGVDPSKFAGGSGRIGEDVARRGLGFDLLDGNNIRGGGGNKSSRIVSDENDGDDNEDLENGQGLDEAAFEALDLSEGNGIIRGRHGRPPTKVGTVPRKVEVLAEVSYIPGLEGRVDARAARQSVRALQPREVIVLGGVPTSNDYSAFNSDALVSREVKLLAEAVQSFASISNSTSKNSTSPKIVWTPSNGETAILAVGHAAYSARLVDTPYRTMEEKLANEHDLMSEERKNMLEPVEVNVGGCNVSLVDCVATGQKVALDNSIVLAPRCHQSSSSSFHNGDPVNDEPSIYLSDGEILLTDLRAELIGLGMKAEYSTISTLTAAEDGVAAYSYSQQLLVNGKIVVRKGQSDGAFTGQHSHVHVEGPLCQDFYTVRGIVCGQYVTL